MKVLVVDDHPVNRRLLRAVLEGNGAQVVEAADGAEALALLEREKVDAVVSDLLMPTMDGFRLLREVRSRPDLHSLPFLVVSGTYLEPEDEQLALRMGADAYLAKPLPPTVVLEALRGAVQQDRPPLEGAVDELLLMRDHVRRLESKVASKDLQVTRLRDALDAARQELETERRQRRALEQEHGERLAAREEELQAARSATLRSLRHEVRQPLNAILGFGEFLASGKAGPLNDAQREHLGDILESAKALMAITEGGIAGALAEKPGRPRRGGA